MIPSNCWLNLKQNIVLILLNTADQTKALTVEVTLTFLKNLDKISGEIFEHRKRNLKKDELI